MENKVDSFDEQASNPREGSGSLLAAARKKQNKSVDEIAAELNLSITQIKTIELDQSEGLPEPTYVRGYIRSYARLLGLDAEDVLKSYLNPNWRKSSSLDEMPKGIANADEASGKGFFTAGKVITLLLILCIAAFLWFSGILSNLFNSPDESNVGSNQSTLQQTEDPTSTLNSSSLVSNDNAVLPESSAVSNSSQVSAIQTDGVTGVIESDNADGEATTNTQENSVEGDVQSAVTSVEDAQVVDNQPSAAHNLVLNFIETCWVDIRDSNDKRLAYKSYYAGEELSVSNDGRLNVFLGNADGVKATYNGEPFDMSSYREGVYAKFSLRSN